MATQRVRDRCREQIQTLSRSATLTSDQESLQREAIACLQRVIGFDRWCWPMADPETLLPGIGAGEHDYGPALPRALELEYSGTDYAAKDVIARSGTLAGSLDLETGGDLARSPRWDEVLRPVGIGDVVAAACHDASGCWGWIEAYRDAGDEPFSLHDIELLAFAGQSLGTSLRRTVATSFAAVPAPPEPPGILVLDRDLRLVSQTAAAARWLSVLPLAQVFAAWGMLPAPVYPAATLARAGRVARAHVLVPATDGRQVRIEAALLEGAPDGNIAVTLRAAAQSEVMDLAGRAHGLSPRERQVVALLTHGLDSRHMAKRLDISTHTLQDHLKSVFGKLNVHSRRELLARLSGPGPG